MFNVFKSAKTSAKDMLLLAAPMFARHDPHSIVIRLGAKSPLTGFGGSLLIRYDPKGDRLIAEDDDRKVRASIPWSEVSKDKPSGHLPPWSEVKGRRTEKPALKLVSPDGE